MRAHGWQPRQREERTAEKQSEEDGESLLRQGAMEWSGPRPRNDWRTADKQECRINRDLTATLSGREGEMKPPPPEVAARSTYTLPGSGCAPALGEKSTLTKYRRDSLTPIPGEQRIASTPQGQQEAPNMTDLISSAKALDDAGGKRGSGDGVERNREAGKGMEKVEKKSKEEKALVSWTG